MNILSQWFRRGMRRFLKPALGTIVGVETNEPVAALTFDDGPDPVFTSQLLDILGDNGAKATFFVLGCAAQKYPELVRRMVLEKHEIGNHSWDHSSLPLLSLAQQHSQLARTRDALAQQGSRIVRPPYGHQDLRTCLCAKFLRSELVAWSFHAEDWLDHDADQLAAMLIRQLRPGSIVLLHDRLNNVLDETYRDRTATLRATEMLSCNRKDFEFVTVTELRGRGKTRKELLFRSPDREFLDRLDRSEKRPG